MTTSCQPEHWGIIGGGMLGMTLALRLAQAGKRVTVLEGAEQFGGLASAWTLNDVVWDRHYHVTLLSDAALRALLAELGLEQEMQWVETRTGFYTDGKLYSMSNLWEFLRFPPLGFLDKLRLGGTIFHASKLIDWRRLERVSASSWLIRWSGRRTYEKIWLPLLRAKLGENYQQASAAFIWAIIARMYAARRTGLKKEMFGYLHGGYARLLGRFTEVLRQHGVVSRLGHAVSLVEPLASGGVRLRYQNGRSEDVDQAVVTVAAPLAARICPGLSLDERSRLNAIQYQGIVCVSLLLEKPLAGFYVTNITDDWVPFTAVIEMSALVDRQHFGGKHLVYLPKYVPPDDPLFTLADAEIESRFVSALTRMYPSLQPSDVRCCRVSRVRQVLAVPTLNYSARLPAMTTSLPGVYIVNSAHILNGTLNVNETVRLAERAAARLLAAPSPITLQGRNVAYASDETARQLVAGS
jgi:protoporphyrinogen oxidase